MKLSQAGLGLFAALILFSSPSRAEDAAWVCGTFQSINFNAVGSAPNSLGYLSATLSNAVVSDLARNATYFVPSFVTNAPAPGPILGNNAPALLTSSEAAALLPAFQALGQGAQGPGLAGQVCLNGVISPTYTNDPVNANNRGFSSNVIPSFYPLTSESTPVPFFRLYNPSLGQHFYTDGVPELTGALKEGWTLEATLGNIYLIGKAVPGLTPLYRFVGNGGHYYSVSSANPPAGYTLELIAGYVSTTSMPINNAVYEAFNPSVGYFYTTSKTEYESAISADGYSGLGVVFYTY